MDTRLKELLDRHPSIIRNMLIVRITQVLSGLFFLFFTIMGSSFLLNGSVQSEMIDWVMVDTSYEATGIISRQTERLVHIFGIFSLVLAGVALWIVMLSRMLVKRNRFIRQLKFWQYDTERMAKAKTEQSAVVS